MAFPTVVFVIDALDESEDNGKAIIENLVNFYTQYQINPRSPKVIVPKLKFLVTSRPYIKIQRPFGSLAKGENSIQLSGDGKIGVLKEEIELVVDAELCLIEDSLRLPNKVTKLLKDHLSAMDNRNYFWLHLVLDVIKESVGAATRTGMQNLIAKLPRTVEEAYEAILRKSFDPEQAAKLLHIVVAAIRPVTVAEMRVAIAIDEHTRSQQDMDLESMGNFDRTIRNQCGLFITVTDQTIYLVHNTAKDFLLSAHNSPLVSAEASGPSSWKNSIDYLKSHEILSWACIRYLSFSEFKESRNTSPGPGHDADSDEENSFSSLEENDLDDEESCNSLDSMTVYDPRHWNNLIIQRRIKKHQFLEYASSHWLSHFEMASPNHSMIQQSLRLCDVNSKLCSNLFEALPIKEDRDLSFFKRSFEDSLVDRCVDLAFYCFIGYSRGTESLLQEIKAGVDEVQ